MKKLLHFFFHFWKYQWLECDDTCFYTRKCSYCGKHEIKHLGLIGDNKFHDVDAEPWKSGSEIEKFNKAVPMTGL